MAFSHELRRRRPDSDEDECDDPRLYCATIIHRMGPGGRTPTKKGRKIISAQQKRKGRE